MWIYLRFIFASVFAVITLILKMNIVAHAQLFARHSESKEYMAGQYIGQTISPLTILLLAISFFALFKRFRNSKSLSNVAFWTAFVLLLSVLR